MIRRELLRLILAFLIFSTAWNTLVNSVSAASPYPTYSNAITPGGNNNPPPAQLKDLEVVFSRIINIATTLAIFGFFAMFVVAAFKYLTSGGDPKGTEGARNTMTYAIIGMLAIVSSYIILSLLGSFTGLKLTSFTIPQPTP